MSEQKTENPKVSVFMATYYHEAYLRQAVESVLRQNVSFPYEIVISDDGSKDGTPQLIKELASEHDCIRYVINPENIGLTANVYQVKSMCRGEYLLDLSGDDYWIDDQKMQQQADFLDSHPEYIAVGTRIETRINEETEAESVIPSLEYCDKDITLEMFLNGVSIPLNGMMMRNVYKNPKTSDMFAIMPKISRYIDDLTDEFLLHLTGKIWILPEVTAVYRIIKKEESHNYNSLEKDMVRYRNHVELLNHLSQYFDFKYDFFHRYKMTTRMGILHALQHGNWKEFNNIFQTIPETYRKRSLFLKSGLAMASYVLSRLRGKIAGK